MNQSANNILNIFAHHIEDQNTIKYRVQWSNRTCEWVDGNNLNNQNYGKYLIKYWKIGPREYKDQISQTDQARSFDFSITQHNINKWTSSFRPFSPQKHDETSQSQYHNIIPNSIHSIDANQNLAMVEFPNIPEPVPMKLDLLLSLAPKMIAQFYLSKNSE